MSKQPPPAPTASAVGPCPTVIKIVGRPGTESLPSTFAPPDHPLNVAESFEQFWYRVTQETFLYNYFKIQCLVQEKKSFIGFFLFLGLAAILFNVAKLFEQFW